jgi:hypothetical protein
VANQGKATSRYFQAVECCETNRGTQSVNPTKEPQRGNQIAAEKRRAGNAQSERVGQVVGIGRVGLLEAQIDFWVYGRQPGSYPETGLWEAPNAGFQ